MARAIWASRLCGARSTAWVARSLAGRLVTYATGAAPHPGDQPEIEAIVRNIRERDYGLRSLVHEIVQSRLFLSK